MLSLILGVMSLISTFELKFHHKIRSYFTAHCPQYTFQVIMIFFLELYNYNLNVDKIMKILPNLKKIKIHTHTYITGYLPLFSII